MQGEPGEALPFPGFATDLQAQMITLLTQTSGAGIITENVYENRLQVAEELKGFGPDHGWLSALLC